MFLREFSNFWHWLKELAIQIQTVKILFSAKASQEPMKDVLENKIPAKPCRSHGQLLSYTVQPALHCNDVEYLIIDNHQARCWQPDTLAVQSHIHTTTWEIPQNRNGPYPYLEFMAGLRNASPKAENRHKKYSQNFAGYESNIAGESK